MGPEILRPLFEGHILALIWVHHLRGIWGDDIKNFLAAHHHMTPFSGNPLANTNIYYHKSIFFIILKIMHIFWHSCSSLLFLCFTFSREKWERKNWIQVLLFLFNAVHKASHSHRETFFLSHFSLEIVQHWMRAAWESWLILKMQFKFAFGIKHFYANKCNSTLKRHMLGGCKKISVIIIPNTPQMMNPNQGQNVTFK